MDTLQLFMVAISIIVSIRGDLAANDRPAAHVAAGVPVGVAINKTVGCNGDLTRSFVDFTTRGNKGNHLLSGRNRADRSQATTVVDEGTKSARSRGKKVSAVRNRSRASQGIVYSLSWNFGSLRERTRDVKRADAQFADIIVYIVVTVRTPVLEMSIKGISG